LPITDRAYGESRYSQSDRLDIRYDNENIPLSRSRPQIVFLTAFALLRVKGACKKICILMYISINNQARFTEP
jgi:hypothetical protein